LTYHLIGTPSSGDPSHHSPQRLMDDMQYVAEEILPTVQA
jgi:hypothetical protein